MEGGGYYVRARGKISGPFDLVGLQKLIRRNALSRMHEVSSDRREWAPAGQFEELFPAVTGRAGGIPGRVTRGVTNAEPVEVAPVAPAVAAPIETTVAYY